ncbi:MAG: hypothetical protein HY763_02565 [Planctomycetes bacterium]|nr:hypothetical protein [Planctomycetota bacterium]
MFERRLKVLLLAFAAMLLILLCRLIELQIVRGDYYRQTAERALMLRPRPLPFIRGSVLDRTGEVLVAEAPCWDLRLEYSVIAAEFAEDPAARLQAVRTWKRSYPQAADEQDVARLLGDDLRRMWSELALFATSPQHAVSVGDLRARAEEVHERVQRIRSAVAGRRGYDAPVAEEGTAHTILPRLSAAQQIAARERFAAYSWVRLEPASARAYAGDAEPLSHLLGRVGRVDAATVASDPDADDPFAAYRADEAVGVSGAEYAAESLLRGRRGQVTTDREGAVIDQIEAEHGKDVRLTIHAGLQRRLYTLLGETVAQVPQSSGGAIVVLDVPTRDILALVSYPAYDPARFEELYALLRDDTQRLPLWFRAVGSRYAPGSTVKPLACLAGLFSGRITTDTREECTGYLLPDQHDRWRCWEVHGTSERKAHGSINVTEALTGSCNIFMYRLGERLGVDRLCSVFDMAGVGRAAGTGLREEDAGINPTPDWLQSHKHTPATPAHARLFAMGQGELAMTPLQVANLMATYACGRFRPATLIRRERPTPEWKLPGTPAQWAAVREGIYGVVNDPEGTAYKYAHFEHPRVVLCGKTGSATAYPWPTAYRVPYRDETGASRAAIVPAGSLGSAVERFEVDHPGARYDRSQITVAAEWPELPPPPGESHSHAWFGGFLQPADASHRPDWSRTPRVAFAVLVEFGGSGGRTSGPLAKAVATEALAILESEPGFHAP